MAINLDHVTEQITVTDTAANADLTYVTKGTGSHNLNTGNGTAFRVSDLSGTIVAGLGVFAGSSSQNSVYLVPYGSAGTANTVLASKGAGSVFFATNTNNNSAATNQAAVTHTASAVNYVQATGAATGSGPTISAQGSDTNADLNVTAKGTGGARFNVGNGSKYTYLSSDAANNFQLIGAANTSNLGIYATGGGSLRFYTAAGLLEEQLRIPQTASAVNFVQIAGATTGNIPSITAQGSDTAVSFQINSKGNGNTLVDTGGVGWVYLRPNQTTTLIAKRTASSVNYISITPSVTSFGPVIAAEGSDTNIPLVLQPKGTGALQAQQTDSTATGGNARGANAVDWQTARGLASQVANGTVAVIGGGQNNTSSGLLTTVAGGFNNNASGNSAFIGGGQYNVASQIRGVVVGGGVNTAAGIYNFVGGGFTNSGTANGTVTTQSGTMNGTTAVTLSGSNASIKVGQYITGTSISADTYVAAISGTSLTLSQAASGSSTSTLSFYTPHGVVVGGGNNTATGSYSFIGGGGDAGTAGNRNVASGDWSTVGGGFKNTASGLYSTVVGGYGNTANNIASFLGGGGFAFGSVLSNIVQGQSSGLVAGIFNNVTGNAAFAGAGYSNLINGQYAACMGGSFGNARSIQGNHVFPANVNPIAQASGITQGALLVLAVQTTDATATVLRSDGGAAGTNNQVIMPNNSAYFFTGEVVAGVTGGGNTKGWTIEGVIKRGANAASTALVGTPTVTSTYADAGASTWVIAVTADTTNGGLAVTFTGQASTTIRTVCQIRTTEMTY